MSCMYYVLVYWAIAYSYAARRTRDFHNDEVIHRNRIISLSLSLLAYLTRFDWFLNVFSFSHSDTRSPSIGMFCSRQTLNGTAFTMAGPTSSLRMWRKLQEEMVSGLRCWTTPITCSHSCITVAKMPCRASLFFMLCLHQCVWCGLC